VGWLIYEITPHVLKHRHVNELSQLTINDQSSEIPFFDWHQILSKILSTPKPSQPLAFFKENLGEHCLKTWRTDPPP